MSKHLDNTGSYQSNQKVEVRTYNQARYTV